MSEEENKNPEPVEPIESESKSLLKPKQKRVISEELRKKRADHMKAINQVRMEKIREKNEKLKPKDLEKVEEVKQEEPIKSVSLKSMADKPKKKKIIKIVNEPESDDDGSEEEIVIVNRVQKNKSKAVAQPKVPTKPEIICKFV